MAWTESGSRDEWLAEVRRRGERLRRRRRVAASAVGALALVLPVLALVSLTGSDAGRQFQVTAAGPAPDTGGPPTMVATTIAESVTSTTTGVTESAPAAVGGTVSSHPAPTTTEAHGRVAIINGRAAPATPPPTSYDDPVVRPPQSTVVSSIPEAPRAAGPGEGASGPCPPAEVSVTVTVERPTYGPGDVVKGSTTIRNNSSTTCLLAPREVMHIEDQSGKTVGNFAYTMEFRPPVVAEPGRTLTATFQWDQKDCSGSTCAQVPAGTYVAVARWPLNGPPPSQSAVYGPARTTFQIGG